MAGRIAQGLPGCNNLKPGRNGMATTQNGGMIKGVHRNRGLGVALPKLLKSLILITRPSSPEHRIVHYKYPPPRYLSCWKYNNTINGYIKERPQNRPRPSLSSATPHSRLGWSWQWQELFLAHPRRSPHRHPSRARSFMSRSGS